MSFDFQLEYTFADDRLADIEPFPQKRTQNRRKKLNKM